ncbi:hypothetical protein BGZ75_002617 [Mortierella antarctica]|nr:hypothetical protein BGZ75_002617 [Mortierella antarctica]
MLDLLTTTPSSETIKMLKTVVPIGVGIASAAYFVVKTILDDGYSLDKTIPTVPIRRGDYTHDYEYMENPDAFLKRCEEKYGPVFNCNIRGAPFTVISGAIVREIFTNDDFSFKDAAEDITGSISFTQSIVKSCKDKDAATKVLHEIIRDNVSNQIPLLTPRIVRQMTGVLERDMGNCDRKLVENPMLLILEMVSTAMVDVFMGDELAKNPEVVQTFAWCTYDFGQVIGPQVRASRFTKWFVRMKYIYLFNPLPKHVKVLIRAATPIILQRRKEEEEAVAKGIPYNRPMDILQGLLDDFEKYNFIDIDDVCGFLVVLVLTAIHSTTDSCTNMTFYLAAYPEVVEPLYQEQVEVLDQVAKERELERQEKLKSGEVSSAKDFEGTELDPKNDRDYTANVLKRLEKMDSFIREVMRFRMEKLRLEHMAMKDITLSNGMVITKGKKIIVNVRSVHQDDKLQDGNATEFLPWRFVGKNKASTPSVGYLSFGMGRHACPGRFLAVQELKTVASLMVSRYSKFEFQDPSKTTEALLALIGSNVPTGLYFTSRVPENAPTQAI